MYFAISYKLTY